jgi:hypothetical protein
MFFCIAKPILRLVCCGLSLGLLILAAGCGGGTRSVEHAEVTGRVLYEGNPLPGGVVNFVTIKGAFANMGIIDENGNYQIKSPVGEVQIGVSNKMLERESPKPKEEPVKRVRVEKGGGGGSAPLVKGRFVNIAPKYYDPATSGLKYTVKRGAQTHDIELSANP